jgi:hypothetical protein
MVVLLLLNGISKHMEADRNGVNPFHKKTIEEIIIETWKQHPTFKAGRAISFEL